MSSVDVQRSEQYPSQLIDAIPLPRGLSADIPTKTAELAAIRTMWTTFLTDIAPTPRPSGALDAIVAKAREIATRYNAEHTAEGERITFKRDGAHNVVFFLEATPGYESHPAVGLQAHTDAVDRPKRDDDPALSPAIHGMPYHTLVTEGGVTYMVARNDEQNTSAGYDDGTGVAIGLTLLEEIAQAPHPPTMLVLSADEEVGLVGAGALGEPLPAGEDLSEQLNLVDLQHIGVMINLDSEDMREIAIGAAGLETRRVDVPILVREPMPEGFVPLTFEIGPFKGGHSGNDIGEGIPSTIQTVTQLLVRALETVPELQLIDVTGGEGETSIPVRAQATIAIPKTRLAEVQSALQTHVSELLADNRHVSSGQECLVMHTADYSPMVMQQDTTQQIILEWLAKLPFGVNKMSDELTDAYPGMVALSTNVAMVHTNTYFLHTDITMRSYMTSLLQQQVDHIESLAAKNNGSVEADPHLRCDPWEPDATQEPIIELAKAAYLARFGEEPQIKLSQGGLEPSALKQHMPNTTFISLPNGTILGPHSVEERIVASSAGEAYLLASDVIQALIAESLASGRLRR